MTDIVERLRNWEQRCQQDAADEIERLRAEVAEYERWQREMVVDYRLLADDHRISRQGAINGLIHELRSERDALLELLREAREWIDFGGHHTSEEECYVCERLARIDEVLAARGGR